MSSKGALDVEIGRWLLVAQREGVERELGFGSFAEYVERRLGFDARTTYERLRVARALETLPGLAALLRTGERSWSAVRELTRVAKPENEAAWIEASERKTVRQIEAEVSGREPGDNPWDDVDPLLVMHRLVFEVPPDELAEWKEAAEVVRREIGPAATSREVLRAMVQMALGQRAATQPGYQVAVTVCAGCERTWQRAGSEWVEVAPEVGACARCDAQVVGVVEVDEAKGDASAHVGTSTSTEPRLPTWARARRARMTLPTWALASTRRPASPRRSSGWCAGAGRGSSPASSRASSRFLPRRSRPSCATPCAPAIAGGARCRAARTSASSTSTTTTRAPRAARTRWRTCTRCAPGTTGWCTRACSTSSGRRTAGWWCGTRAGGCTGRDRGPTRAWSRLGLMRSLRAS